MELDLCLICHEELCSKNSYKLPECKHTYHTDCIIDWFTRGSSKCPYCSNKGINHLYISDEDQQYLTETWQRDRPILYFHTSSRYNHSRTGKIKSLYKFGTEKLKIIKKYVKENDGPSILVNEFKLLDKEKEIGIIVEKNRSDYKKILENNSEISYEEADKQMRILTNARYKHQRKISVIKNYILSFPIHSIIIPTTI